MNKYRKEYCKENGSVKINPENTKLYDYIKHLENKLEQAEQLTLTDVGSTSCGKCDNTGVLWSKDRLSAKTCGCK